MTAEIIPQSEKPPWVWSKPWVVAWVVNVVVMAGSAAVLSPRSWAILAAVGFGSQEGFALWHGWKNFPVKASRFAAPYPPLTYVCRYYLPRWTTYTLTGALIGAIGTGATIGLPVPVRGAVPLALFAWLVEHWEVTYREITKPT